MIPSYNISNLSYDQFANIFLQIVVLYQLPYISWLSVLSELWAVRSLVVISLLLKVLFVMHCSARTEHLSVVILVVC